MARVAVIGGGILGLAAAHLLAARGARVILLEAGPELGGLSRTLEVGGVELDIGVRIMPASYPETVSVLSGACGGTHRFLPMADRARLRGGTDRPASGFAQFPQLPGRLSVALRRLAVAEDREGTLRSAAVSRITEPLWEGFFRPLAECVLGAGAGDLPAEGNTGFGLFGAKLRRGPGVAFRAMRDVVAPLLRPLRGREPNVLLGPSESWPDPKTPFHDLPVGMGMYPRTGAFGQFVRDAARQLSSTPGCEAITNCRVTGYRTGGGRLMGVDTTTGPVDADAFVVSAGLDGLLAHAGQSLQPTGWRTLVQTSFCYKGPVPDWLYEIHFQGIRIARAFFPQRFQGLATAGVGVVATESWCEPGGEERLAGDREAWTRTIWDELVRARTLPRTAERIESRVDVVPRALMVYPRGWFGQLGGAITATRNQLANVGFTGMPATLAPVTPAAKALALLPGMVDALLEGVG